MKEISAPLDLYLGLDVVAPLIGQLEARHAGRHGHFFLRRDITLDDVPRVDAILCRDVLTHLPLADVTAALRHFKASGSAYLIATTHDLGGNREIDAGGWQQIDLQAPPFNLPRPFMTLVENPGEPKTLGVWRREQLPAG